MRAAFLQAGADIRLAAILVKSIRTYHPRAEIVQCSDEASPQVPGVDEVIRGGSARGRLMMFRTSLFARVAVTQPTLFLDTDMIFIGTVDLEAALGAHSVAVCTREFDRGGAFNINFRGMMMTEHAGKTLMTMRQEPFQSSQERDGHQGGWGSAFDRLADLLVQVGGATGSPT